MSGDMRVVLEHLSHFVEGYIILIDHSTIVGLFDLQCRYSLIEKRKEEQMIEN